MPKPVLQSLILADHVYEDKLTGKRIIAGVFNRIIRGVRVLRQMGPPMPQVPQQPPVYNPPPQPYQPPGQPGFASHPPAAGAGIYAITRSCAAGLATGVCRAGARYAFAPGAAGDTAV